MTIFKPISLDELVNMPSETAEQAYRRGYRDGFIVALYAAFGSKKIPKKLWDFWQDKLLQWENTNNNQFILPPTVSK